jgi:plasmid stabilization system protein ParE
MIFSQNSTSRIEFQGVRVKPTPFASDQIREESRWWRINRTYAPRLFQRELRRAFKLIAEYPDAGALTDEVPATDIRRLLLVSTQHYLYYRVIAVQQVIEVLGIWSTSRGEPPRFR